MLYQTRREESLSVNLYDFQSTLNSTFLIPVQSACVTVAAFVQYFLMAAFCWMLIEGVYLYLFVVKVYNISDKMKVSHGFSWGNYEIKNPFSL